MQVLNVTHNATTSGREREREREREGEADLLILTRLKYGGIYVK